MMSPEKSLATFMNSLKAYWKGLTLCAAAIAWVLASTTPKFGFVTKLTFGAFLVRTYWPEILVALLLMGAAVTLSRRLGLHSARSMADGKSMYRRAISAVRQVTVSDRIYGLIVVGVAASVCIPLLWKQVGLMWEAEQTFMAARLMNWFGDDLHRIAARQINEGNYELAARTLMIQAKELGDLEEGHTAERIGNSLASRLSTVAETRQRILDRIKRGGVVRGDLLMLGTLQAMLPPHPLGVGMATSVPGAESVHAYLAALRRIKAQCDGGNAHAATAQDVGMGAAALGFARWPSLLFGRIEDVAQRARVLCEIVGPRDAAGVDGLHRAAYSVSAPSERPDWRIPAADAAATPGVMVVRSFGRAIDTVIERAIGRTPIVDMLPSPDIVTPAAQHRTPVIESAVVSVVELDAPSEADSDSFEPVTLLVSAEKQSQDTHVRVQRRKDGMNLTLCIPSDVSKGVDGYALKMREDGRLQVTATGECAQEAKESDTSRSLDASLLSAISRFIALGDAGRMVGESPGMRGSLCRVLVAGVAEHATALIGVAINLCPIDAAARGLSVRPVAERQ